MITNPWYCFGLVGVFVFIAFILYSFELVLLGSLSVGLGLYMLVEGLFHLEVD